MRGAAKKTGDNGCMSAAEVCDALDQLSPGRCVSFVDNRVDYGEERFISIGTFKSRVVVIAHAPRGPNVTRIVSMRKANRRQQKLPRPTWPALTE
jgi:uncharacterized DUF497 family protein